MSKVIKHLNVANATLTVLLLALGISGVVSSFKEPSRGTYMGLLFGGTILSIQALVKIRLALKCLKSAEEQDSPPS